MINPNICKRVNVEIVGEPVISLYGNTYQYGIYKGFKLDVYSDTIIKPGKRRLYLKYSIINDRYYLTKRS